MSEKYNITYSNGALRVLDEMKNKYELKTREDTLSLALFVLKRLHENGNVSLKEKHEQDA